jgi:hypothetical protein
MNSFIAHGTPDRYPVIARSGNRAAASPLPAVKSRVVRAHPLWSQAIAPNRQYASRTRSGSPLIDRPIPAIHAPPHKCGCCIVFSKWPYFERCRQLTLSGPVASSMEQMYLVLLGRTRRDGQAQRPKEFHLRNLASASRNGLPWIGSAHIQDLT